MTADGHSRQVIELSTKYLPGLFLLKLPGIYTDRASLFIGTRVNICQNPHSVAKNTVTEWECQGETTEIDDLGNK